MLLGDVIMDGPVPATRTADRNLRGDRQGRHHVEEVPRERLHFYGIIDATPAKEARWGDRLLRIKDLVEKPSAEKAPSNWGVTGRYVLPSEIFGFLEKTKPGAGGEIQLTDGLRALAQGTRPVGVRLRGQNARRGRQTRISESHRGDGAEGPKTGQGFSGVPEGIEILVRGARERNEN